MGPLLFNRDGKPQPFDHYLRSQRWPPEGYLVIRGFRRPLVTSLAYRLNSKNTILLSRITLCAVTLSCSHELLTRHSVSQFLCVSLCARPWAASSASGLPREPASKDLLHNVRHGVPLLPGSAGSEQLHSGVMEATDAHARQALQGVCSPEDCQLRCVDESAG
jgi:hypothetical protein